MHPELFKDVKDVFEITETDLQTGFLRKEHSGNCVLNLPEIDEEESFKNNIYDTWMEVRML